MDIRQEIFDFLTSKTGSSAPTTAAELSDFQNVLAEKVSRLSVTVNAANGAVTLLYTGFINPALPSFQLAEAMGKGSIGADGKAKIITIGQTEAGKFLSLDEFRVAMEGAVGVEKTDLMLNGTSKVLIDGELKDVRTNSASLFDQTSRRVVFAAPGDFISLALDGRADGVFAQTEFVAAMDRAYATPRYFNNTLISDLIALRNDAVAIGATFDQATDKVRAVTTSEALIDFAKLDIAKTANGYAVGTERYLQGLPSALQGTPLPQALVPNRVDTVELTRSIVEANRTELGLAVETIRDSRYLSGLTVSTAVVNHLGAIGAAAGFVLAVGDANRAFTGGDKTEAGRIMAGWAAGLTGALTVGTAAAAGTAANFWYLAYGGPVGIAALTVLSVGTGVVAGYVGEKGAHALFESIWPSSPRPTGLTPPFAIQRIPEVDANGRITGFIEEVPVSALANGKGLIEYTFANGTVRTGTNGPVDPANGTGTLPPVFVYSFQDKVLIPKEGGGYAELVTSNVAGEAFSLKLSQLDSGKNYVSGQKWETAIDATAAAVSASYDVVTYDPAAGVRKSTQTTDYVISNDGARVPQQQTVASVLANGDERFVVRDIAGNLVSTTAVNYFYDDSGVSRIVTTTTPIGVVVTRSFDTQNQLASTITDTPEGAGGITRVIDTTADGKPIQITQHASAASLANGEQPGDYTTTAVKINGEEAVNNNLIAASIDSAYPSAKDIILNRGTGEFTHIVAAGDLTNEDGTTPSLVAVTGRVDWWNDPAVGALASDTVSLISALRSGKPLPIATAGLNFASHQLADPAVAEIAAALSAVGSLKGLVDALEKGDLGRILIDGGGVARSAITIYSNSLQQEMITRFGSVFRAGELGASGNAAAAELYNSSQAADALLQGIGQAIAVLNIINSLANGDIKGAVIGTVGLVFGPVAGAILTVADIVYGLLFTNDHQFEAEGRYVGGANGDITVQIGNHNGGAGERFFEVMQTMLEQTRKQATEIGKLNGQPMGVIAERLPTIEFKQDVMFLRFSDPLSGQSFVRTFDMKGKYLTPGYVEEVLQSDQTSIRFSPWGARPDNDNVGHSADPAGRQPNNQIATAKNFFDNIAQQYSDAVTKSGAIAPLWEVETVNLQRLSGYQYAGQTTEEIAYQSHTSYNQYQNFKLYYGSPGDARPGNHGPYGVPLNETSQQTATVIALDLNDDGVITVTKKATGNGVLFDVDNDGFAEETDWIGPRDGILVLDRTSSGQAADGQINRGVDLFNDTWVDGTKRKLTVLNEINDNNDQISFFYGGGLNAQDPVFSHLKVWMDINGDGVAQDAELQTLSQLGITNLSWNPNVTASSNIGSITQNGQTRLLQSVDLQANAAGVATSKAGNSLLVTREEVGQPELYATAVIDYGQSTDAAVRTSHTHVKRGTYYTGDPAHPYGTATLIGIDEVLDGQEDTAITISVAQLLKNDSFVGHEARFGGLRYDSGHGDVTYDSEKQTITFTPLENFNGVASFEYLVRDELETAVVATAYIDIGAIDDAPTIAVTSARRQASWNDLVLTANPQGAQVYALAPMVNDLLAQLPADPAIHVNSLGYLGDSGTALLADSVGIIGFAAGKLFFAPFGQAGNAATQLPWREVWVEGGDGGDGASSGTITVTDVDGPGAISIALDSNPQHKRDGQFGTVTLVDHQNGTASYSYKRTSLSSQAKIGPDDAFYVQIRQPGPTADKPIETYQKVIVNAGDPSQPRNEDDYVMLNEGTLVPPQGNQPAPTPSFWT